ncbi:4'-phosphopantetheinyl transferase Npt [Frankia canadensis]|uniref:4'-phosphopantetheinyl transferase Npt n=1 Tax=Frankia canadensis TaxID=1836972 RepID=A0A2I2L083_9ACTN|nr:4'-phosphopantetheinyl transferase superfamily protein [Frankia canadensis]SNQ51315.1 4'-phosphopantetheinyl transferase Npt [Frankia canadensis]SOU58605.1 4'-phosphopantetheinyl transferase Npt [Frankia canadensis]
MLASLLPASAVAVEAFEDDPAAVLFPEESALLARAVDKRRREFTTARVCAHRALRELGLPPAPILPGPRGAPGWPAGVVGSITHCAGYRAAAVARAGELRTIGIDAEPNEANPRGVTREITVPAEEGWLATLTETRPSVHWDRLLFSAKESVYKAWFPLAQRWLGFEDAALTVDPGTAPVTTPAGGGGSAPDPALVPVLVPAPGATSAPGTRAEGTFTAKLLVSGPTIDGAELTGFDGRWLAAGGLLITAITVPHLDGTPMPAVG